MGPAALHAAAAKQHRDAAFNAHAETLTLFKCRALLQGFPLRGLLPTALRNAHLTYSRLLALIQIFGTVKAPVTGIQIGGTVEALMMSLQRSLHLAGIGGIAVQHLVVGDQALRAFRQKHFVTELYRFARLAALDQIGVRFEDRVHFLLGGNLLSMDYSAPCLIDDPIPQLAVCRDLVEWAERIRLFHLLDHLSC